MFKINKGYLSLYAFCVSSRHRRFGFRSQRWNPNPYNGQQIVGAFQPIVDIGKDLVGTFRPYKAQNHAVRDFLQPLRGVGNILKGVANLIIAPLLFPFTTIGIILSAGSFESGAFRTSRNIVRTFSWLVDGVASIVRGISQIALTPFTWCIKMPLRGLITAIFGAPKIEQSSGIQRLVKTGKETLEFASGRKRIDEKAPLNSTAAYIERLDNVREEIHRKYLKAAAKGQKTDVNDDAEYRAFNACENYYGRESTIWLSRQGEEAALKYLSLFNADGRGQKTRLPSISFDDDYDNNPRW